MTATIVSLIFFVIILIVVSRSVVIVRQAEVYIIERLGKFHKKLESGLHVIVPFFDSIRAKVDLREQVVDYPKQPMITKDNVRVNIDAVIYYQIMDPIKAVYEISNLRRGIELLTMTNLRNIVGELTLDEVLVSREVMNEKLRQVLDEATDKWGVRINRVEIKDIEPPSDVVETMQKQMAAEREKRAKILIAEGNKQSQILEAEGHRQAQILRAEGEAQAILRVQSARAEAIKMIISAIREASPDDKVVALRYIEALEKLAQSDNKVFVPYEASAVLGAAGMISDIVKSTGTGGEKDKG